MVKLCKKEDGEVKKGGCYGGGSLLFLSSPPVIVPLSLFLFFRMPQECECMIRYTNESNGGSGNRCSGLEENLNTVEALLATTLIDDRL